MNDSATLSCQANSLHSDEDMVTLSMVSPYFSRAQIVELRTELSRRDATFRSYNDEKFYYDMDQLASMLSKRQSTGTKNWSRPESAFKHSQGIR